MHIVVHPDADHLAEAAADLIAETINARSDRFSLGLAGGGTPIATYQALRDRDVRWTHVDAWMSDERWVPPDHPDCNGHQAARELLDHVHARFHRPRWAPWLTPADSAAHFEATLRSLHPDGRADMILLGLGDDGHTASLFPETEALDAPPARWFVDNYVPRIGAHRLTATFSFLRAAHRVVFLVAGPRKAGVLRSVLEREPDEDLLPAARVLGGEAEVIWLVDEAAAAELSARSLT